MGVKVIIITKKVQDLRFNSIYEVHVQPSPEFMNDQMASDSEKLKHISSVIGVEFYKFFNRPKK